MLIQSRRREGEDLEKIPDRTIKIIKVTYASAPTTRAPPREPHAVRKVLRLVWSAQTS